MLTSRLRPKLLLLILLFCPLVALGQSVSPQYTVTDLGDFSPRAINDSSTVVGSTLTKAILWRNGVLTDITPSGGPQTIAQGRPNCREWF